MEKSSVNGNDLAKIGNDYIENSRKDWYEKSTHIKIAKYLASMSNKNISNLEAFYILKDCLLKVTSKKSGRLIDSIVNAMNYCADLDEKSKQISTTDYTKNEVINKLSTRIKYVDGYLIHRGNGSISLLDNVHKVTDNNRTILNLLDQIEEKQKAVHLEPSTTPNQDICNLSYESKSSIETFFQMDDI